MDALPICTHCGFTWGEYRARGLLGCPHCYAAFGDALLGDLMWIHQALSAAAPPQEEDPAVRAEQVAHWREQLADALRKEDYPEAARLRRLLASREPGRGGGSGGSPAEGGRRSAGHGLE